MKLLLRFFIYNLFCWVPFIGLSQQINIDTLKGKTAQELLNLSATSYDISILEKAIQKAKQEDNISVLINSYNYMALRLKDENTLLYSDSIIALKEIYNNSSYPATAYYNKGFYFFNNRNFIKATDNFIKANEYANRYYNRDIIVRSKQNLGLLKKEIGDYQQALAIYKENYEYVTSANTNTLNTQDYLEIIYSIASVYNKLNKHDSTRYYTNFGIEESLRLNKTDKYNDFLLNEAEMLYNTKEYDLSVNSLKKALSYYESSNDQANLSITYYYLAKNYFRLHQEKQAVTLLEKVDSLFQKNNDLRSKVKVQESYELLISYYKDQKLLEQQIIYQDKKINLMNKLHANEIYLNKKIVHDYDIPSILAANKKVYEEIRTKKEQTTVFAYFLIIIIIGILIILFYLNSKRKIYKKRFEELINKTEKSSTSIKTIRKEKAALKSELKIPDEVVSKILSSLEKFEQNDEFLNSKMSISTLAKTIGTNPNYLSKTVNHFKEMSFSQYINTLRIEYAITSLQRNKVYKKYTLKAIAAEFGFNNTESFSKAFYKETGIKPSFFMKNLKNAT